MSNTLIIPASVSASILRSDLMRVKAIVAECYIAHLEGRVLNPSSATVHISEHISDRGIALPAYLRRESRPAIFGMKWITSRLGNEQRGLARAHGVVILNCPDSGVPLAILEASDISAFRTAASACLAAEQLHPPGNRITLGVVGCGYIAASTVAFLLASGWDVDRLLLADTSSGISDAFKRKLQSISPNYTSHSVQLDTPMEVVRNSQLTVFATTSQSEYFCDEEALSHNPTILHISLRDLTPAVLSSADNFVDDLSEATRPSTGLGKAVRDYGEILVKGTLGELLIGKIRPDFERPRIFSPYGLGMLDLALSEYVWQNAVGRDGTVQLDNFYRGIL